MSRRAGSTCPGFLTGQSAEGPNYGTKNTTRLGTLPDRPPPEHLVAVMLSVADRAAGTIMSMGIDRFTRWLISAAVRDNRCVPQESQPRTEWLQALFRPDALLIGQCVERAGIEIAHSLRWALFEQQGQVLRRGSSPFAVLRHPGPAAELSVDRLDCPSCCEARFFGMSPAERVRLAFSSVNGRSARVGSAAIAGASARGVTAPSPRASSARIIRQVGGSFFGLSPRTALCADSRFVSE